MSLGYLPLAVMGQNFQRMITSRRTTRLLRAHPRLVEFIHYMEATYVGRNALFPPAIWNVFDRRSDNRTNNRVEGIYILA